MSIKLNRFFSGIMEAAWLAAVSIVPIFFNIYSSRIFEPDKITILRSLALLLLGAWLLKLIDEGATKWKENTNDVSLANYLWHFPMVGPITGLVIVYIISTIFSVTPSTSLFGSYQRLQGTYTTFSYLIIFIAIISNLRRREQVNRLITTVIMASLPVSLYGLLQRYQIDPIPWSGSVSIRIASNLGNSIFVAAYLIMVFPLTIGRMLDAFKEILSGDAKETSQTTTIKQIIKATIYVFIASLELIAIYMSGSRGPMLGLMAGTYLLILLLSIYWKKRWLTFAIVLVAVAGVAFLAVFNLKNGPLEGLKESPAIGRFGLLLDPESNSALVRQYIWEGTVNLVGIHDPLKFPDGNTDKFNVLRPIIGYGPESMYVAYNQFYQPDLGRVEKRNASPDRSHNETWDSIVITGIAGLLVYLSIFSSVFYYGLKWLGFIRNARGRNFFFLCLIGGGLLGSIVLIYLRGVEFLGVGLPLAMIIGVVLYLTIYAIISPSASREGILNNNYSILMISIFAAIVGHFIEINFGIAIVATRTLFWTYAGVLVVIGYIIPKIEPVKTEVLSSVDADTIKNLPNDKRKSKRNLLKSKRTYDSNWHPLIGEQPNWVRGSMISAFIVGIILVTLGFNYITNTGHNTSIISIILNSFSRLPNKDNAFSLGVLVLILMTWITGVLLFYVENEDDQPAKIELRIVGYLAIISILIGVIYWLVHSLSLAILAGFKPTNQDDLLTQVNSIGSLLTKYYLYVFLLIFLIAFLLPKEWPRRSVSRSSINIILAPLALVLLFVLVNISNLRVIQADINFKTVDPFIKSNQWEVVTFLYKRALALAPREDHYYLFLGRSYLEQAKITEAVTDQDNLILQAEKDLKFAQTINPLNTDHTANLARLYSWWAGKATTSGDRQVRGQKASEYYATAVTLSPNNSTIWDEWAVLYMQVLGQATEALQRLQHALSLDDHYSFTQGLLGDYYMRIASSVDDVPSKIQALETASQYYETAANVARSADTTSKATYLVSLGNVYLVLDGIKTEDNTHSQLKQIVDKLIVSMETGVSESDKWKVQEIIAKVYVQLGEKALAQKFVDLALQDAPDSAISRIQELNKQITLLP